LPCNARLCARRPAPPPSLHQFRDGGHPVFGGLSISRGKPGAEAVRSEDAGANSARMKEGSKPIGRFDPLPRQRQLRQRLSSAAGWRRRQHGRYRRRDAVGASALSRSSLAPGPRSLEGLERLARVGASPLERPRHGLGSSGHVRPHAPSRSGRTRSDGTDGRRRRLARGGHGGGRGTSRISGQLDGALGGAERPGAQRQSRGSFSARFAHACSAS
jgi:hypothetical protein